MPGELQQTPAGQQADRQAADVAEKDLCDRPVEGRKSKHRPEQRRGSDRRGYGKFGEPAEQKERAFGLASAIRTSSGRIAHVRTPDNSAAGTAAANDSSSCELAILSAWKVARKIIWELRWSPRPARPSRRSISRPARRLRRR